MFIKNNIIQCVNNFLLRYWAITDPMTYPAKMTDKRAAILIMIVWICSSTISFPAIAWWRATAPFANETTFTSGEYRYHEFMLTPSK